MARQETGENQQGHKNHWCDREKSSEIARAHFVDLLENPANFFRTGPKKLRQEEEDKGGQDEREPRKGAGRRSNRCGGGNLEHENPAAEDPQAPHRIQVFHMKLAGSVGVVQ